MEEIYFRKSGKGKPIILIHGFCETHEVWDGLVEKLSQSFEVYSVDLPGFGGSTLPATPFTLDDISEKILRWVDNLEVNLPFLIGHSLGGYVGLAMARKAQQKISGLCLFHSTPHPDTDERKANRNRVIEFVKKNGVDPFVDTFVPGLFVNKNHPGMPGVFTMARRTSKETLLAYTAAMRDRASSVEFLQKFEKPVLVIAGENDSLISKESVLEFGCLVRKGNVQILENTGHMGMLEQTAKSSAILSEFIDSTERL
jgi:pimeloyl-ACP methyl ester carboxylesterase